MQNVPAIGIDLGTTFSCVAYVDEFQRVITCKNEQGNYITPSMVAFKNDEIIVGAGAKSQVSMNPKNTVYDVKRLIGKKLNDKMIEEDIRKWSFTVVEESGKPMVEIECNNVKKRYHAEQISAYIIQHMKSCAEKMLNAVVTDAVITVPAAFNDSQRQAVHDAGSIAGLNVLRIINEPTAAAISFGFERNVDHGEYVLVYDLGGGTFDVSILIINKGVYEVKCSDGDPHLGGQDFDALLMEEVFKDIKETRQIDITANAKATSRIRTACEAAKITLSAATEHEIYINNLFGDEDYEKVISRSFFENACNSLFFKTIDIVNKCLSVAELTPSDIEHVVLAGGSSRIPKLHNMLQELFKGKHLDVSNHVDQSIARGAALQAAMLQEENFELVVKEVASNSLGLELKGGKMFTFIKKNTSIPCSFTRIFCNAVDNQKEVHIKVFEGEEEYTRLNRQLDQFSLTNITPAPRGTMKISVKFSVDENSILEVTASEKSAGSEKSVTIEDRKGRLSKDEIERARIELQLNTGEDGTEDAVELKVATKKSIQCL